MRPVPPPNFRFPADEACALLAAIDQLSGALTRLRAQLVAVMQSLDEVIAGRTANRVDEELGLLLGELGIVAARLEESAAVVEAELAAGRSGQRRHAEAMWRHEQDVLRWRARLVRVHG